MKELEKWISDELDKSWKEYRDLKGEWGSDYDSGLLGQIGGLTDVLVHINPNHPAIRWIKERPTLIWKKPS